jgi:DNA repair protein RecO (recombination protein O)
VLRIFEKNLLGETGYGLMLDHEAANGPVLRPDRLYDYLPEVGPVALTNVPARGVSVRGSTLLALSNERFNDAATLREARTLLRACLARHLGDRPLESRRLIRAARAAPTITAESE